MNGQLDGDPATLARLHAALDSVVETEDVIAAIHDSSGRLPPGISRVGELLGEVRQVLHSLVMSRAPRATGSGASAAFGASAPAHRVVASRSGQR